MNQGSFPGPLPCHTSLQFGSPCTAHCQTSQPEDSSSALSNPLSDLAIEKQKQEIAQAVDFRGLQENMV